MIIGAISVGIVGVIVVAMVIYTCCFKQKLNPNQRRELLMRKGKGGGKTEGVGNNSSGGGGAVMIERYTPTKYTNAISAELFYPTYDHPPPPRSTSVESHQDPVRQNPYNPVRDKCSMTTMLELKKGGRGGLGPPHIFEFRKQVQRSRT